MSTRLVVEPEAEADLAKAYKWYEKQRVGLGDDFMLCIEASLSSITELPGSFPFIHKHTRRALVRRFPYLILFVQLADTISVIGVFHVRRDPAKVRKRSR